MIKLYHGTNANIGRIDLSKCHPYKDFGRGFYLTDIEAQAEEMAERRVRIARCGKATTLAYLFNEKALVDGTLRSLVFEKATREWATFILNNRMDKTFTHDYDVVVDPIADDGVVLQLDLYARKIITLSQLVKKLTYRKLNRQYCFSSYTAISKLIKL